MQKPVKKSHFEGFKEVDKINNYLVDMDRDMFNFYQYFINFPKVYIQATQPSIPKDSIALWDNTTTGHRFWIWNTGGTQNALDFAAAGGSGVDHSLLSNLTYATAGHTGFQASLSTGNLNGSSPISVAGGDGAIIGGGAIVSIAQSSTSQGGYVSATDWGTFFNKADYVFGDNNFSGTGNFVTTGSLSANIIGGLTVNASNSTITKLSSADANITALTLSEGLFLARTKTGNYTITDSDIVVVFAGVGTCSLPNSTGAGRLLWIKNVSTGNVTVDPNLSETIDGELTQTLYPNEGIMISGYSSNAWAVI